MNLILQSQVLLIFFLFEGHQTFSVAFTVETRATRSPTKIHLNLPNFGKERDDESKEGEKEKKIGFGGLLQLITAGVGSPFLGDYEGIDKETGNFMFSLEANNLVDEKGNSKQTQAPYFESGWVPEEDLEKERKKKGGFKLW